MSFVKLSAESESLRTKTPTTTACLAHQELTKGRTITTIGRFECEFQLSAVQRRVLERMHVFYDDETINHVLRPMVEQHHDAPSIRSVDWFLTNYAKSHRVTCVQPSGEHINIYHAYKTVLNFYRRRNFDGFRRKMRIVVRHHDGDMTSTVAQLNFYAWAHSSGALDWCRRPGNARLIEKHMNASQAHPKDVRKPRRRPELSAAPRGKVAIYTS